MPRYIILVGNGLPEIQTATVQDAASATGLRACRISPSAFLLTEPATRWWRWDERTVIIGDANPRIDAALDEPEVTGKPPSRAQTLCSDIWGGYVALLHEPSGDGIEVIRDPSGAVPCHYSTRDGWSYIAASVSDLARIGAISGEVDWGGLAAFLSFPQLRSPRTALDGATELLAGASLQWDAAGDLHQAMVWSPWRFARAPEMLRDPHDAARQLRRVILQTIARRVVPENKAILRLSGGLDSSVVAAAMKAAGIEFVCTTYATQHISGDERDYARLVSRHLGVALQEVDFDPMLIDPTVPTTIDIARPTIASFTQLHRQHLQLAQPSAHDIVVDGTGGDNVFCYLHSAATVADAIRLEQSPARWYAAARDMSDISHATLGTIAWATLRKLRQGRGYRWRSEDLGLSPDRVSGCPYDHPWLAAPRQALAGSVAHVANLLQIQNHLDASVMMPFPALSPLLSQPIVELSLRIPSYLWSRGGVNRRVARDAFQDDLPSAIIDRRDKGTPISGVAAMFEQQWARLRDAVLGGTMAAAGFLDLAALERAFVDNRVTRGSAFHSLLRLAEAEAWVAAWKDGTVQPRSRD